MPAAAASPAGAACSLASLPTPAAALFAEDNYFAELASDEIAAAAAAEVVALAGIAEVDSGADLLLPPQHGHLLCRTDSAAFHGTLDTPHHL